MPGAAGHDFHIGYRHEIGRRHALGHLHTHHQPRTRQTRPTRVSAICVCFFGVMVTVIGIMLTAVFAVSGSGVVPVGVCVLAVGAALVTGACFWMRYKQRKADRTTASAQAQEQPEVCCFVLFVCLYFFV
ncbi:hypothetical protein Bbelb_274700 [Branchiostoma belcheri]|nr:hypothetical protein Bbelb_274700 [Branchiostoma belcheri]